MHLSNKLGQCFQFEMGMEQILHSFIVPVYGEFEFHKSKKQYKKKKEKKKKSHTVVSKYNAIELMKDYHSKNNEYNKHSSINNKSKKSNNKPNKNSKSNNKSRFF